VPTGWEAGDRDLEDRSSTASSIPGQTPAEVEEAVRELRFSGTRIADALGMPERTVRAILARNRTVTPAQDRGLAGEPWTAVPYHPRCGGGGHSPNVHEKRLSHTPVATHKRSSNLAPRKAHPLQLSCAIASISTGLAMSERYGDAALLDEAGGDAS
jgi:hypothetical protein